MLRRASYVFFVLIALGGVYVAHAQLGGAEALTISLDPEYPRPYQIVTVTPESNLFDLAASTVTFSLNGRVLQKSTGSESASVALGGPGSTNTITVTAVNNGQTYTKSITVRPADVALIVEPVSSTHPLYEGASLIGSEGKLRIIAVPDLRTSSGVQIASSNLVYTWRNGDQILQSSSGIGKSVLTATAPVRYRSSKITLTVTSQDNSVVGQAFVVIAPRDPLIRIYENDALLGPRYETALPSTITMNDTEATYRAVPYYFTTSPTITWEVNGTASQSGQDITVRPSGDGKGTALLGTTASTGGLGQSATTRTSITFGKTISSIFGF